MIMNYNKEFRHFCERNQQQFQRNTLPKATKDTDGESQNSIFYQKK